MTSDRLIGQTVLVIGGSSGIGQEIARLASEEGARLILAGRNPAKLAAALPLRPAVPAPWDSSRIEMGPAPSSVGLRIKIAPQGVRTPSRDFRAGLASLLELRANLV